MYLQGAPVAIATPGFVYEPGPSKRPMAAAHLRTDGTWLWPEELPTLIRRYRIRLPEQFVEHMAAKNWVASPLSTEDLAAVEAKLVGGT